MNQSLFLWFNGLVGQSAIFDALAFFVAHDLIFILAIGYLGLVWRAPALKRQRLIVATLLCFLVAFQLSTIIHLAYPEPRPQLTNLPVNVLIDLADTNSFPSQHALFAFLLAGLVYGRHKKLGLAYLALAAIIALSRVVVGVHWPLDVLVGALIGIGLGYLGTLLLD